MNQIEILLDENGHPMEFRMLGKFSVGDTDYIVMEPVVDLEPLVYILWADPGQDDQKYLVSIDDDELAIAQRAYGELIDQEE